MNFSQTMEINGKRQPSKDPPQCTATTENFYNHIIEDVITKCGENHREDGLDATTLEELKSIWTKKLQKSVKIAKESASKLHVSKILLSSPKEDAPTHSRFQHLQQQEQFRAEYAFQSQQTQQNFPGFMQSQAEQNAFSSFARPGDIQRWQHVHPSLVKTPVEVKINVGKPPFSIIVQVTQDQINGNRIEGLFTKEILNELMHMGVVEATERMQSLIDAELLNYLRGVPEFIQVGAVGSVLDQVDGSDHDPKRFKPSSSDASDSSDVDDVDDDDSDDLADLLGEDDDDSEPDPDSNDDITEEEVLETDNLIVCQFTHVKRQKNHWKFRFENGIMIIDGVELVFQRATGEAFW